MNKKAVFRELISFPLVPDTNLWYPFFPMTTDEMEKRLIEHFPDADVLVSDLTGGGDHFEVRIAASQFANLKRIQQHQAVMAVFDPELKSGEVHALSVKTLSK